jgi:ribonuclease P protein component
MRRSSGAVLRPRERLRTAGEYQRVFRRGLRIDGALFLLVAAPNNLDFCRLGLAAGRRLGPATTRNRAKRLLREAFRRHKGVADACDLILLPKPGLLGCTFREVEREYRKRLRALAARRASQSTHTGAAGAD